MIHKLKFKISFVAALVFSGAAIANVNLPNVSQSPANSHRVAAGDCAPATSQIDLNINNVRARIMNGGDMWWDLVGTARYIIPKVETGSGQPEVSSLFAGAIWIGGYDPSGNLKIAAATYRQNGNDYFPGPLDALGATDAATCSEWDKHFNVYGADIDAFILQTAGGLPLSPSSINPDILNWPGRGNPYNTLTVGGNKDYAPFADVDGDGKYDPTNGDFPIIGGQCQKYTYADQMIWWVYNDNGNIHTESSSAPIDLEVHALAFAYKTNDEVNDMTFYKYTLNNKASSDLTQTFMGVWVDPDLGCYTDDFIGCSVPEGLGVVYNSDANDEPCPVGYGTQPPILGIDYFQGPKDQNGNELGMSSFLYYVNDFSVRGNPEIATHYYGYMSGFWKDGTPFTDGGNAYGGTTATKYVFPSSPADASGWSMCHPGTTPADMRFIQSSGPFILKPGATNDIIMGVVWVRPPVGTYPCPKFDLLLKADKKAQALFDNCFELIDGPNAPDMSIVELDKQLVLQLENTAKVEAYAQVDPILKAQYPSYGDSVNEVYRFEGYQIYQLVSPSVSNQELNDPTKAKLIYQVDKKNGIGKIINYVYDANVNQEVPTLMVDGADDGVKHSFSVTDDGFASGNKRLINHKSYYFMVLSYAYNGFDRLDTTGILYDTFSHQTIYQTVNVTQRIPYLSGRKNIKVYTAIPHIPSPEQDGMIIHSGYGTGPQIMRIEGQGNGGNSVELTDESIAQLLANPNGNLDNPIYKNGEGPVVVKVVDPKKVPSGDFELWMNDTTSSTHIVLDSFTTKWTLKNLTTGEVIHSDKNIDAGDEQLISDWGLSIYIKQVKGPGGAPPASQRNIFNAGEMIESSITYQSPQDLWLSGIHDGEGQSLSNWIRSGVYLTSSGTDTYNDPQTGSKFWDAAGQFEDIIDGTWAPFKLVSRDHLDFTPGFLDNTLFASQLGADSLMSIDFVYTPDKSKWTKCLVVEANNDFNLTEGGVKKAHLRRHQGWNGQTGTYYTGTTDTGVSWFPGYAINPETGERLNIIFAEDSWQIGENGRDMIWNPTANNFTPTGERLMGGKHYIYVLSTRYNDANFTIMYNAMKTRTDVDRRAIFRNVVWTSIPMLNDGYTFTSWENGFIPTETKIKIRVNKQYQHYQTNSFTNNNEPKYSFSTKDIAVETGNLDRAVSALDTINIVPNPYYAFSAYEHDQLDTRVKITNLPIKCTISVYALNGSLIRKIERDDNSITSVDWDLKNNAGVPIASGVYLIHINAPGIGERTIKWVGIMRPADLDSF